MARGYHEPSQLELKVFQVLASGVSRGVRWWFERDAQRAPEVHTDTLLQILRTHASSEYGRKYGFSQIRATEEYVDRVPLVTYADLEAYVERMAKGEDNVLSALPIDHFMLTSGTSRAPKLIPTNRAERQRRIPFYAFLPQGTLAQALGAAVIPGRGMNGMSIASSERTTDAGIRVSSSLRIGLAERTWLMKLLWSSPVPVYCVDDVEDAYYLHWLFALRDRDLAYVSDEFASKMTYALTVLVRNADRLARDLELGRIDPELEIEPTTRAELERLLGPMPTRAAEVRAAFAASPEGAGILQKLWPKLCYVACIYTGTFGVYEEKLRSYCGSLPVFNTAYGLSEICVATAIAPDDPRYVIYPRAGFHEFIREVDIPLAQPRTYLLDELEIGECYEVVATNMAGLYRYRTADVVKVVGMFKNAPVVEFQYRANVLMNLNAEMMTEHAAFEALKRAAQRIGVRLVDHTIRADTEAYPPRYAFYVEVDGRIDDALYDSFDGALDAELRAINPRYEDRIERGRLQKSNLVLVGTGSFEALSLRIAADAHERGISAVQTKIPRLLSHEPYVNLLEGRAVRGEKRGAATRELRATANA